MIYHRDRKQESSPVKRGVKLSCKLFRLTGCYQLVEIFVFLTAHGIFSVIVYIIGIQFAEMVQTHIFIKTSQLVTNSNYIFNIMSIRIQFYKFVKVISNIFIYKIAVIIGFVLHILKYLVYSQRAKHHILCGNKLIVIKKRQLDTAATHIYNKSTFLDELVKPIFPETDCLITNIALFRIAEYLYLKTCPLFYLVKNNNIVVCFADSTCGNYHIVRYVIFFHLDRESI